MPEVQPTRGGSSAPNSRFVPTGRIATAQTRTLSRISMPSAFVVIVNFRTGLLVADCLASLAAEAPFLNGGKVIVVDNASGDDSLLRIESAIECQGWREWVEVLPLPRNGGFAYGNNAGIARARELDARFAAVILLNPDTVVRPGTIGALVGFFDQHRDVGIVGASIEDARGRLEITARRDPSPIGELGYGASLGVLDRWLNGPQPAVPSDAPQSCDWVSGACMGIRRETLDAVGTLDEGFFLYFEEVDYCSRARRLGWSCWFVPRARVVHLEGAATGIKSGRQRRPAYWYASRRRFFTKRYGVAGLLAADALWSLGRLTLVLRRALRLGGHHVRDSEPRDFAFDLLVGDLRALLRGELSRVSVDS